MPSQSVYVAGHRGLVGSAVVRDLKRNGYANLITRTRQELDLLDRDAVCQFLKSTKPDHVLVAAAKVGGIKANSDLPDRISPGEPANPEQPDLRLFRARRAKGAVSWKLMHLPEVRTVLLGRSSMFPSFDRSVGSRGSLLNKGLSKPTDGSWNPV